MRNQNRFRRAAGVLLVTLTVGACDFISPVESNPNSVPEATVDQLFTGAQVVSYFLSHGGLSRIASIWTQQMAGTDRQFSTFDSYVITDADFEDEFNALYTQGGLIDIRAGIALAEAAGRRTYAGILKVHEAYLVGLIASFYGDIPYSQAVNPDFEAPILDDQAAVYAAVQTLLDEAITDLAAGGAGPGAVDLNFAGNAARWTAVANTLKARFYMHWGEVNGAAAYTSARTYALLGVTTAAGTWKSKFGTAQTEANLWTQFLVDRSGYVASGDYLVPLMVGNADPRIGIYFSEASAGVYTPRVSLLADPGYGAAGYDLPIVSCAENYFILAEAELRDGSPDEAAARTAANNALDCQEAEHGASVDLSGEQTTINGLSGAALFDEIMEQKYIAMFLNPEAYNDYKRTCRPAITERAAGMPGRLFYSSQERQSNPNVPNTGTDPNDKYNDNDPTPC